MKNLYFLLIILALVSCGKETEVLNPPVPDNDKTIVDALKRIKSVNIDILNVYGYGTSSEAGREPTAGYFYKGNDIYMDLDSLHGGSIGKIKIYAPGDSLNLIYTDGYNENSDDAQLKMYFDKLNSTYINKINLIVSGSRKPGNKLDHTNSYSYMNTILYGKFKIDILNDSTLNINVVKSLGSLDSFYYTYRSSSTYGSENSGWKSSNSDYFTNKLDAISPNSKFNIKINLKK